MESEVTDRKREKKTLRKQILQKRDEISPEQKKIWDRQILERLTACDAEDPCQVYLCYVSYKSEVSTKEFIGWCLKREKAVFVPKVKSEKAGKKPEMEFYRIFSLSECKTGYQGILEPEELPERFFFRWFAKAGEAGYGDRKTRIRMLLPGAVFDRNGNRIGYGGGFYDRWLDKWENLTFQNEKKGGFFMEKIGLAYNMQLVPQIPAERFDKRVDRVITEEITDLTKGRPY